MCDQEQTKLLEQLKAPFHPARVSFRPITVNKDGTRAKVEFYANQDAYVERLNDLAGLDWSITYTPWGERIVCHLTIKGVTRSASGEPGVVDPADMVAFRRAAAMFGLGRYLLALPEVWMDYEAGRLTEAALLRLEAHIVRHYREKIGQV